MIKELIRLRAHHGMCLLFFEGKGYSEGFTSHMQKVQDIMRKNPQLFLIAEADEVCSKCPNLTFGKCGSYHLVKMYDEKVLHFCGLDPDTEISWKEFSTLVKEKIILQGKRHTICGGCEWREICDQKEKEIF